MKILRKIDGKDKETVIEQDWISPGATAHVLMKNGDGDNASARFLLEIDGGQVYFEKTDTGGSLEMFGEWERECFIELLKQIIIELELVDN